MSVPSSSAQMSWKRNFAPAWNDVAMAPASKNPPTLVMMPRASCVHLRIGRRRSGRAPARLLDAAAQARALGVGEIHVLPPHAHGIASERQPDERPGAHAQALEQRR